MWAAILAAVPRSRLVLKNKPFACEAARSHLLRQLAALGVEGWRVDLLPLAPGNSQHLSQYALMDISLDPFPYAGEREALCGEGRDSDRGMLDGGLALVCGIAHGYSATVSCYRVPECIT